jgi:carboxylesterase type B
MSNSITADVGSYGKVKGFVTGNVAEFRGIPFGKISARFRRGGLVTSVPGGTYDATKWGPYPPQQPEDHAGALFLFGDYIKTFFAEEEGRPMGEDCLNLNIVTPKDTIGGKKKLPVMVWIYGMSLLIIEG